MSEIIIIGAGIVGAMVAYELSSQKNLQVTLIDAEEPASGATQAALGVLMGIISHKTKGKAWQLRKASLERYATLLPELESLTGDTIPHNKQGIVLLRLHPEETSNWEKLAQTRAKQGFNLELWSRQDLQKYCPQVVNEQVIGAVYSPGDLQINPTILTQTLVAAARKNGVITRFGLQVLELVSREGSCYQIHTNQESFNLDWLIICTGIGTTALSKSLDIRPVLGQALQIKLPHPLGNANFQPVLTGEDVHIVPLKNAQYWLGATLEFPEQSGEILPNPELLEEVKRMAFSFCPELAQGQILRTWQGKRPRPEGKSAPVLEYLDNYDNVLLATGHYRNGILLAPATAQWVKETIN